MTRITCGNPGTKVDGNGRTLRSSRSLREREQQHEDLVILVEIRACLNSIIITCGNPGTKSGEGEGASVGRASQLTARCHQSLLVRGHARAAPDHVLEITHAVGWVHTQRDRAPCEQSVWGGFQPPFPPAVKPIRLLLSSLTAAIE